MKSLTKLAKNQIIICFNCYLFIHSIKSKSNDKLRSYDFRLTIMIMN